MAKAYDNYSENGSVKVVKKGGILGKVIALLLGLILGIIGGLGGLAGAIYHFISSPIDKTVDTVEGLTGTNIDISQILTDEYASKSVLELVGEIQTVAKEFSNGTGSFDTLNKISPTVEKSVEKIVEEVSKYGLDLNKQQLMSTPFKELGSYINGEIDSIEVGTLMKKLDVNIDNPVLMSVCYGELDVDYVMENGEPVAKEGKHFRTIGELKDMDNVISTMTLHSLLNQDTFDPEDPIMSALAFGPQSHYTLIEEEDGKKTVKMNQRSFAFENGVFKSEDETELVSTPVEDEDGNLKGYFVTDEGVDYFVKEVDGVYLAYDKADYENEEESKETPVFYKKTTVGDLTDGNVSELMNPIEVAPLLDVQPDSNQVLITLAYGVEGEDFDFEYTENPQTGKLEKTGFVTYKKPRTLGDLMGDELSDMLDTLPLDSLMDIDTESELMLAIAYGDKSHYDIVDKTDANGDVVKNEDGTPVKEVKMKEIEFTLDANGGKFIDKNDKTEYTYTIVIGDDTTESGYNLFAEGETEEAKYFVKEIDGKYYAYDVENAGIEKYEKTTLSMLQTDADSILNNVELGAAMNVTPESNTILIAIAYGNEGEDFDYTYKQNPDGTYVLDSDGNKIKEGFKMKDGKKPMTIGDMQDNETMNDKIETLPLDMLLEVDYNDKLVLALAYGPSTHYTLIQNGVDSDGNPVYVDVEMNEITFEYDAVNDKLTDVDDNVYAIADNGDGSYTATLLNEKGEIAEDSDGNRTEYLVKNFAQNSAPYYAAYDEETNEILTFKATTVGELQDDPTSVLNNVALAEVLDVQPNDDPIKIALAYGNEGEDYEIRDKIDPDTNQPILDADGNVVQEIVSINGSKPRTLKELQEDPELFNNLRLSAVLNVNPLNPNADALMVSIAYGNKGTHYEIKDTDNDGKDDIDWLTITYTYDEAKNAFTDANHTVYNVVGDPENGVYTAKNESDAKDVIYVTLNADGKYNAYPTAECKAEEVLEYAPRTVSDLQDEDGAAIKSIELATVLNIDPLKELAPGEEPDDPIMIALAYGNEGEHYVIRDIDGDNKDDIDWLYDTNGNQYAPRTIYDLQNDDNLFNSIRLSTILDVDPLKELAPGEEPDDPIMIALAYGNENEHYALRNDEIVWLPVVYEYNDESATETFTGNGVTYNVVGDPENGVYTAKNASDETDVIYVKLNAEGEYNAYPTEECKAEEVLCYNYRTVYDLQNNTDLFKSIYLATALEVTPDSDAIVIALAYGNEGEDYEIRDKIDPATGDPVLDADGNVVQEIVSINGSKPRKISELQGDSKIFQELRLGTILEVDPLDPNEDKIMVALAYGNLNEHYKLEDIDGDLQDDLVMLPVEYVYDSAANTFTGDGKEYTVTESNTDRWTATRTDGEETETIYVVYDGSKYNAYTIEDASQQNDDTIICYKPRVLNDLQGDSNVITSMQLATVLDVTPASDPLMIALAYGNEDQYDLVDGNGNGTTNDAEDLIVPKAGKKPHTIEELQDPEATLFKDIYLSTVMTPDYDDQIIMYMIYGGGENAHYVFDYETDPATGNVITDPTTGEPVRKLDTNGDPIVLLMEQRIAIYTDTDNVTHVYDEYGFELAAEDYTLVDNHDGSYTYMLKNEDGAITDTYTAKITADTLAPATMTVEYMLDGDSTIHEAEDALVYCLYDTDGNPLYYEKATIGDMQDGKDMSSITKHLTIEQLVGESDSKLFQTVGGWYIRDLQNQDKIMELQIGQVIEINDPESPNYDPTKEASSGLLIAMQGWSLNDLNDQDQINGLKVADIISVGSDSPKVLKFMADPEGDGREIEYEADGVTVKEDHDNDAWTLADLNDADTFNSITLGNVIDIGDNQILKHMKDTPIGELVTEMDRLTVQRIFADQVYRTFQWEDVHDDGYFRMTIGDESSKVAVVGSGASAYYYTDTTYTTKVEVGDFIDENGYPLYNAAGNKITVDSIDVNDANNDLEELLDHPSRVLVGSWHYLLSVDETTGSNDDGIHNPVEKDYTITHIEQLVDNMKKNIEEATLQELRNDGMIENLDQSTLDKPVHSKIGGVDFKDEIVWIFPYRDEDGDGINDATLGELTVMQMLDYINFMFSVLTF